VSSKWSLSLRIFPSNPCMHLSSPPHVSHAPDTSFFPDFMTRITFDEQYRSLNSSLSVLAFSTQVRGFKPGRSRRIFKGEKILSTPSFGGEVKPSVPCRRCKKSLNVAWKSTCRQNYRTCLAHRVPPFATRGLSRCVDVGGHLMTETGTSKLGGTQGCTISL